MPDITMCQEKQCINRFTCYRYMAKPNPYRQSYFVKDPSNPKLVKCGHYDEIRAGWNDRNLMTKTEIEKQERGCSTQKGVR